MVKNHLKRIATPKTWNIPRKEGKFVTRPNPGAHRLQHGMSLSLVMREFIKVAKSSREAKTILSTKDVFVDKKKRTDPKHIVGLMDIIEFPELEETYRILLDSKGRLTTVKTNAKEAKFKLSKITSKSKISKGRTQLHTSDGRNITAEKDIYKTGDTIQLELPEQKITAHYPLEKGALVLLTGGKYSGLVATVQEISGGKIMLKTKKDVFETHTKHAFVIGKDKPSLESIKELS